MTRVSFLVAQDSIIGFHAQGHSGYAESGQDIVCAAVSALTQTAQLGLEEVLKITPEILRDDDRGVYGLELPKGLEPDKLAKAQIIFRTLEAGLKSIEMSYPEFVRVNAKERRWN